MYTFLITKDNTVIATEKQRIMEKTNLVDTLQFIVEKTYNGYDMKEFDLVFEGFLPITHEIEVITLELADENYKGIYYAYRLPVYTELTKEPGDMKFTLTFMKSDLDSEGGVVNYVRRIESGVIKVLQVESWFTAPNSALTQLSQLYMQNQQNIQALRDVANELYANSPDGLRLDTNGREIYMYNNNTRVGNGIGLDDLKNALDSQGTKTINI